MKSIKNSKQMLFEMMEKIDPTFKPKMNEDISNESLSTLEQIEKLKEEGYTFSEETTYFKKNHNDYSFGNEWNLVDEDTGDVTTYLPKDSVLYPMDLISLYYLNKEKALQLGFNESELGINSKFHPKYSKNN